MYIGITACLIDFFLGYLSKCSEENVKTNRSLIQSKQKELVLESTVVGGYYVGS